MASVTIRWENGKGAVIPTSISVSRGQNVDFTAEGSGVKITFPDRAIIGALELYVAEGKTESRTIRLDAPLGTHSCPTYCDKDVGDAPTTPPVEMSIG